MAFDFEKLKDIAKRLGGILVMQGNDPEFVIMSYEKYEENGKVEITNNQSQAQVTPEDDALVEQLNKEILALKEEIRQKEASEAELI